MKGFLGFLITVCSLFLPKSSQLQAADFTLISSNFGSAVTTNSVSMSGGRFTLSQTKLSAPTASRQQAGNRFSITSKVGSTIVVNEPGLPRIRLKSKQGRFTLEWDEQELTPVLLLEYTASLKNPVWLPAPVQQTPTGKHHEVPVTSERTFRFYRLRKP